MAAKPNRREECLEDREIFRKNAAKLIEEMVFLSEDTEEDTTPLVDEILHSIFFLGRVYDPQFSPESIEIDQEMREFLADSYPEAFRRYSSRLPHRAPFSCVLDMIVHIAGQENEEEVKNQLQQFVQQLEGDQPKHLLSTTMCISQINSRDSGRHYGVSMSTFGRVAGKIMVAASCLQTWHQLVAGAVLSYDQRFKKKMPLRSNFNGTIRLPQNIRCQAYNIRDQTLKRPCSSCGDLFGLNNTEEKRWRYGNCAEVESVSKLLKTEAQVTEQVEFQAEWTAESRKQVEDEVRKELEGWLRMKGFRWDGQFYVPQSIQPI
ncbi:uncharacterized protein LOC115409291 [Salarias fasciatus]|uniref:uncharacterized protein LOC115409291 n=1 Tax=Salarias fasciatus TaxID=181472 RepID=UPI001176ABEE|nr:uncharacterized protein LOC115409291 [Salarias fasciatus]